MYNVPFCKNKQNSLGNSYLDIPLKPLLSYYLLFPEFGFPHIYTLILVLKNKHTKPNKTKHMLPFIMQNNK
jgi:hypothetical protein